MTVTLREAVDALDERKIAAFDEGQVYAPIRQVPLLSAGLDIDHQELIEVAHEIGAILLQAVLDGETALKRLPSSAWIDGVLTGLLLAQLRKEAGIT